MTIRTVVSVIVVCLAIASVAVEGPVRAAPYFAVTSTHDAVDATPGDGQCATVAGECTLRAAIQETNALPGADTIVVPGAVYMLTIPGPGEDAAATGDLDITGDLTMRGAGPHATIVDGGGLDRVFHIPAPVTVTIQGMTVRHGAVGAQNDSGGGIFNGKVNQKAGFLKLINVTLTGNTALFGGGLMNGWGASAMLRGVTVSMNSAAYGAGLYTRDTGTVRIFNSTFSNNTASAGGGGIDTWFNADVSLTNVTTARNSAVIGAGINREVTTRLVTLSSTIVADNAGGNCAGVIVSAGYNLASDATCSLTQPTDLPSHNPLLGPLQDNGGPTPTHALLTGSPAIDAGSTATCLSTDQRYYLRPTDGNGDGIAACDIGAYEKG